MKNLILLLVVVGFAGCASLPPKTAAIHDALVTESALRQATESCAFVDYETKRLAERSHVEWLQRNEEYIGAADWGLLELTWEDVPEGVEDQRAVLAMQMLELIQQDGTSQKASWLGDSAGKNDCESLYEKVNKGKLDLNADKDNAAYYNEMSAKRKDLSKDADAARSINNKYRGYGRSLIIAEKALKAQSCSSPKVSMIRNSWPLEVYDAVCSDSEYKLVQCEWGRCVVKQ
ncbi:hypothetical protein [Reinekea marinisedimentorum]|uniref:Uncharacterized protein n=1 Tax=Reinekea marinisedimentorum TaxID=230495 RepID=A0A4R3IB14_9GAMM|nr:hypothetical protein [Reinekea marinisedimentorum]TCS42441.1 hypothetical protein BCF53_103102 [Reinekea marinisedimentorum]